MSVDEPTTFLRYPLDEGPGTFLPGPSSHA